MIFVSSWVRFSFENSRLFLKIQDFFWEMCLIGD